MATDGDSQTRRRIDYLDFEIEIGKGSDRDYQVAVIHSPAGEARGTMRFPYEKPAGDNPLQDLEVALLRSSGSHRQVLPTEERPVQAFCEGLFDALFAGPVRSLFEVSNNEAMRQGKGLRLKLRILPPELAILPWEFLKDPAAPEYLCLSRDNPIVRYLEVPMPVQPLRVAPPLEILGMLASPADLPPLDVGHERQRIENALSKLQEEGLVKLTWVEGQSWRDLQGAMLQRAWHIFHFVGHGGFDQAAGEGLIALTDDSGALYRLHARELAMLLTDQHSLRLVLLNSCEGARGSKEDIFSSTASILVRRGIPAVLAMQYEISDVAAIEFARTFYEMLARGLPVDAATAEGRKAVGLRRPGTLEWATPVLYMHASDGMIFELPEEGAAPSEAEHGPAVRQTVMSNPNITVGGNVGGHIVSGDHNLVIGDSQRTKP